MPLVTTPAILFLELITYADEPFTGNRHVRAQSVYLRAQTTGLMLTYRAHRFAHLSGGSDATDRATTMRS